MVRIILIGYMGAGKTTIGKALAKELNVQFYDLDWYITSRMRKTVAQIFDERGEEGFREIEKNMLHEVAEFEDVIISCGGGTPCFFDNIDYMNQQAPVVYLKVPFQRLKRRLHDLRGRGVVLRGGESLEEMFAERSVLYERYGDITIEEHGKVEDTVRAVVEAIEGNQ